MTAQLIGVPKEVFPGEKRVATVPEVVPKLAKLGFGVIVQAGAGEAASLADEAYAAAGATVVPDAASVWSRARHHLQGPRAHAGGSPVDARRADPRLLHLAGAEPGPAARVSPRRR